MRWCTFDIETRVSQIEDQGRLANTGGGLYAALKFDSSLAEQVFGVVDLVPSDVLASFFLAAAMQRADRGKALHTVLSAGDQNRKAVDEEGGSPGLVASMPSNAP